MIKQALYFAYGSNLNKEQMERRCPGATALGPAILKDHRLIFRSVADVEPAKDREVQGGLWLITTECLNALDRYEGWPSLYKRHWVKVHLPGGDTRRAIIYQMRTDDYGKPSGGYLASITRGYRDFNLDLAGLARAVEDTDRAARRQLLERAGWMQPAEK